MRNRVNKKGNRTDCRAIDLSTNASLRSRTIKNTKHIIHQSAVKGIQTLGFHIKKNKGDSNFEVSPNNSEKKLGTHHFEVSPKNPEKN